MLWLTSGRVTLHLLYFLLIKTMKTKHTILLCCYTAMCALVLCCSFAFLVIKGGSVINLFIAAAFLVVMICLIAKAVNAWSDAYMKKLLESKRRYHNTEETMP